MLHSIVGPSPRGSGRILPGDAHATSSGRRCAGCARLGFDIGPGTISHIETGLRGVSDLEMVLLARALWVKLEGFVPGELPAWEKDTYVDESSDRRQGP
jgi:hypothetical protein